MTLDKRRTPTSTYKPHNSSPLSSLFFPVIPLLCFSILLFPILPSFTLFSSNLTLSTHISCPLPPIFFSSLLHSSTFPPPLTSHYFLCPLLCPCPSFWASVSHPFSLLLCLRLSLFSFLSASPHSFSRPPSAHCQATTAQTVQLQLFQAQ